MGAIISAIKSFDGTEEAKQEMEVQLDNMSALANAKADYFELALRDNLANAGAGNSKDIPVSFIIDFMRQTHAYGNSSADAIVSTVTDAIGSFVKGGNENIMAGVGALLTKGIQTLFASKEGGENETRVVSVFAEGRALVRLDMFAWKRYTNIKSISQSAEQISAFVMCKSTIDASVLDYNTFIQIYQNALYETATGFTSDEIATQLDEIDRIYKKFKERQQKQSAMRSSCQKIIAPTKLEIEKSLNLIKANEKLLGGNK